MNTKSSIFPSAYTTCENTAFGVHEWNKILSYTEKKQIQCNLCIISLIISSFLSLNEEDVWSLGSFPQNFRHNYHRKTIYPDMMINKMRKDYQPLRYELVIPYILQNKVRQLDL